MNTLHKDFPTLFEPTHSGDLGATLYDPSWNLGDPLYDIQVALEVAMAASGDKLTLWDLDEVTDYYVSSHEKVWEPGQSVGSELNLYLIARLKDGRWIGLDAWNDYTGWGCQDGADVYFGDSREDVIANGITNDGRSALGLPLL